MRTLNPTIRTIAAFGFGQGRMTTIALGGCGVRAVVDALALYPTVCSPESKPSGSVRIAKCESGRGVGRVLFQSPVVWLLRGLLLALRLLRRQWLPCNAMRCDVISPAGMACGAHTGG